MQLVLIIIVFVFRGIKKRQETILMVQSQRRISSTSQGQGLGLCSTVEELVLFAIVFIFLICSIPRVVLNAYELWNIRTIRENLHNVCFRFAVSFFSVSLFMSFYFQIKETQVFSERVEANPKAFLNGDSYKQINFLLLSVFCD